MKKATFYWGVLFLLIGLSGCMSYSTVITLDVKKPAQYTFPAYARKVVLVNNAAEQPAVSEHRFVVNQVRRESLVKELEVKLDSLPTRFLNSVTSAIATTNYFFSTQKDTTLYRSDDLYREKRPLDSLTLESIASRYDADLILILEKAPLKCTLTLDSSMDQELYQANLQTLFSPEITFYYPREQRYDKPLVLVDTLNWSALNIGIENTVASLPGFEEVQKAVVGVQTDRVMRALLPNTERQDRLIYTGSDVNMRDAYEYMQQGKWKEAYWIWDYLDHRIKKGEKRADVLCNLAVYYELNDQFAQAEECLKRALEYLDGRNPYQIGYIKDYLTKLQARSKESDKLYQQLGY